MVGDSFGINPSSMDPYDVAPFYEGAFDEDVWDTANFCEALSVEDILAIPWPRTLWWSILSAIDPLGRNLVYKVADRFSL